MFPNGEKICDIWMGNYNFILWFGIIVSIVFGVVNGLVEFLFAIISEFTKPINETVNLIDAI